MTHATKRAAAPPAGRCPWDAGAGTAKAIGRRAAGCLAALGIATVLVAADMPDARACCGPNGSPEFFRHQYHAFRRGHVPGYLHHRHRHRAGLRR